MEYVLLNIPPYPNGVATLPGRLVDWYFSGGAVLAGWHSLLANDLHFSQRGVRRLQRLFRQLRWNYGILR